MAAVLLVWGMGALLRVFNFWIPNPWLDEYGTWWIASGSWREVILRDLAVGGSSPLHPLCVKASFSLLGPTTVALRLPSILAGLAALALAFPVSLNVLRDRRAALGASVAFAVWQPLIWYSQEARPYAFGLLGVMLSMYCYTRLLQREHWWLRVGYVLATAGAFYSHYLFGLILPVHVVHLALRRRLSHRWMVTLAAAVLLALGAAGHLASLVHRRHVLAVHPLRSWRAILGVAARLLEVQLLVWLAVSALAARLIWRRRGQRPSGGADWLLVAVWILLPLVCVGFLPRLLGVSLVGNLESIHRIRYVVLALPAVTLLVGAIIAAGGDRGWCLPMAVLLFYHVAWLLAPALGHAGTFGTWPDEGYQHAAAYVERHMRRDDLILFTSGYVEADALATSNPPKPPVTDYLAWPLAAHVAPATMQRVLLLPSGLKHLPAEYFDQLDGNVRAYRRVWVVGYDRVVAHLVDRWRQDPGFALLEYWMYGDVRGALFEPVPRRAEGGTSS